MALTPSPNNPPEVKALWGFIAKTRAEVQQETRSWQDNHKPPAKSDSRGRGPHKP